MRIMKKFHWYDGTDGAKPAYLRIMKRQGFAAEYFSTRFWLSLNEDLNMVIYQILRQEVNQNCLLDPKDLLANTVMVVAFLESAEHKDFKKHDINGTILIQCPILGQFGWKKRK